MRLCASGYKRILWADFASPRGLGRTSIADGSTRQMSGPKTASEESAEVPHGIVDLGFGAVRHGSGHGVGLRRRARLAEIPERSGKAVETYGDEIGPLPVSVHLSDSPVAPQLS